MRWPRHGTIDARMPCLRVSLYTTVPYNRRGRSRHVCQAGIAPAHPSPWVSGGKFDNSFTSLAADIETAWQTALSDSLAPLSVDQEFLLCTSAVQSRSTPEQVCAPPSSQMQIENRLFRAAGFRKLHLELAQQGKGLQVLHCVLYPDKDACFPIFSFDMVAGRGSLPSLCIADACPVTRDLSLPADLALTARELQQRHGLVSNREKPAWGAAIFSDLCMLMRPKDSEELASFLAYTTDYHAAFLAWATAAARSHDREGSFAGQVRFCEFQRQNQKTRRMLEAAFGASYASEYIDKILFDLP